MVMMIVDTYLRDRTGEREREAISPGLVFVQTGVRSWTTEKDANNALIRVCFLFQIQRRRQGILRGGNLTFLYISFVNVPYLLPTYLPYAKRNHGDNTKYITTAYRFFPFLLGIYKR